MNNSIFNDASKAFAKMSTKDLKKEIRVFKLMNSWLNNKATQAVAKFFLWLPLIKMLIKPFLRRTVFNIFCGGESISECLKTVNRLAANNVMTILDYSKEAGNENSYDVTLQELLNTIKEAKNNNNISFAVFKMTGIASKQLLEKMSNKTASKREALDFEKVKKRVDTLCITAKRNGVKILIDAEDYCYQNIIDSLAEEMMIKYNKDGFVVYNTIQLYRKDKLAYLKEIHERLKNLGVKSAFKLVRGAYMDKERKRAKRGGYPSPIHSTKEKTDEDYNLALKYFVSNSASMAICAGTHNQYSTELLMSLMQEFGINNKDERVFFAQLLGMADNISNILGNANFNVAKYVPYGLIEEAMPYLIRRADENKSISGEMSRELSIRKEVLRKRKNEK